MAIIILLLIALINISCHNGKYPAADIEIPVFPKPKSITTGNLTIYIDETTFKYNTASTNVDLLDALNRSYEQIFRHKRITKINNINDIYIPSVDIIVSDENVRLEYGVDESYTLTINSDGKPSRLEAVTIYGIYNGLETLCQLIHYDYVINKYKIYQTPIVIHDEPFVGHRGLLIDSARHFLSLQVIYRVIDSLRLSKLNVLHWHIVDNQANPVQSIKYPTFWKAAYSKYERYTQQEMKDVVEYARKRGIRVMIEFDVPGHQMSWCKGLPELCPSDTCLEPLDLTNNFTYEFLSDLFYEMTGGNKYLGIFPETLFHLGGDEVTLECWNKIERISKWLKDKGWTTKDGYLYIVNRTQHIIMDYGRDPVQWEEIWNDFGNKLNKRQIIQIWLNRNTYIDVINNGYRAILSNANKWYLTTLETKWTDVYDNSLTDGISPSNYKYIMGGEVCMWGEFVDVSDLFQTVWPRAAAAAERMWSNPSKREADTEDRMKWFRCYLIRNGIEAAPVMNDIARQHPPHQDSCYIQ